MPDRSAARGARRGFIARVVRRLADDGYCACAQAITDTGIAARTFSVTGIGARGVVGMPTAPLDDFCWRCRRPLRDSEDDED